MPDKNFSPIFRISLEQSSDPVGQQVLSEVIKIENKAKELRSQGHQNIRKALSADVQDLVGRVAMGNVQNAEKCVDVIRDLKRKYEDAEAKQPLVTLAKIEKAKLRINSMSQDEALKTAKELRAGVEHKLSYEDSMLLLSKIENPVDREAFRETVKEMRIDTPWINSPEAHQIQDHLERFSKSGDNVLVDGALINPEKLIDFDGDLDHE